MSEHYRQEHKYTISRYSRDLLRSELRGILTPDPHAGPGGSYRIRSLYFDDTDYTAFREKTDGVQDRSKLRLRFYNFDERYIILEKKERNGDLCKKVTERISLAAAQRLAVGLETGGGSPLLDEYDRLRVTRGLRPSVIVDYTRYAFSYPISDVRLTLDSDLATPVFQKDFFDRTLLCFPVMEPDEALLELKYDSAVPDFLRLLLVGIPKVKIAMSKYARCLERIDE